MLSSPVFADRCLQVEVRNVLNLVWFDFQVARLKSLILTILIELSKYYWFSLNLLVVIVVVVVCVYVCVCVCQPRTKADKWRKDTKDKEDTLR